MTEPSPGEDIDALAESFLARLRRGERPMLSEYAARRPDLASQIQGLFPALVEMEDLKQAVESSARPFLTKQIDVGLLDRVGDYTVKGLIGTGGMGVVYEAERESLQARVALKVLHPRYRDDAGYRRRFRNEARSAARLHHSNIVPVFDFGEHDGILYYAMQFIPGTGLDRVIEDVRRCRNSPPHPPSATDAGPGSTIADGLLTGHYAGDVNEAGHSRLDDALASGCSSDDPVDQSQSIEVSSTMSMSRISLLGTSGQTCYHREVARIGAEVAEALAHAHGRGVLHRDVKPSNLLLDARGTAWITDFGLAKFEDGEDLTETGDVVGTLRYMAPERFDGRSDARCDIYALGATLYEMLALRPAFAEAQRAQLIRAILHEVPLPLRHVDPRISRDLETVVLKAMARSSGDRYGSAAELAAELRLVEANKPIQARRIAPYEQYWRWCRRNPMVAALSALAVALTVVVALVSTTTVFWLRRSNEEVREHLSRLEAAEAGRSQQLWEANLAQARAWRFSRRPGQRFETIAALKRAVMIGRELAHPPERFEALRDEAIAALALPDIHANEPLIDVDNPDDIADVDQGFGRYCLCDQQGHASVHRVIDGALVARLPDALAPRKLAFGPGDYLADLDGAGAFRVWDLSAQAPVTRIREQPKVISWDFAPNGSRLVVARQGGALAIHDLSLGRRLRELAPGLARREVWLRVHPNAPYVAVTSYFSGPTFEIRNIVTGHSFEISLPWPDGSANACWSDDGRTLAVSRGDGPTIALIDFDSDNAKIRHLRTIEDPMVDSSMILTFNQAGDRLFGGNGWGSHLAMFDPRSGKALFQTPAFQRPRAQPFRFDRARSRLLPGAIDPESLVHRVWSVAEGRECQFVAPLEDHGPSGPTAVSPDSRLAIVPSSDGWLTAFDLSTLREVGRVKVPDRGSHAFALFDGSGRLMTNSFAGCYRWPVRPDPTDPGCIVIGPPERIPFNPGNHVIATSRDGKTIVQSMPNSYGMQPYRGTWLFREGAQNNPLRVGPVVGGLDATVSPDGRLAAFAHENGSGVFDTQTGRLVHAISAKATKSRFSPDGNWLAIGSTSTRLYAVGTWEPGPDLGAGSPMCFSAGGEIALLLLPIGSGLRLVEVATGRTLGRFEDPDVTHVSFNLTSITPDGLKLVTPHTKGLRVWDLRQIREGLAGLGLDWEAPPLSPGPRPDPLRVRFVGAGRIDRRFQATADLLAGLLAPHFGAGPEARNQLAYARSLVRLGLDGLASRSFDKALRLDPDLVDAAVERGLLRFRRGKWEGAAADFSRALSVAPPNRDLSFRLAWAHFNSGRLVEAAAELKSAIDLTGSDLPLPTALLVLRAEVLTASGQTDSARADLALAEARSNDPADTLEYQARLFVTGPPERRVPSAAVVLARRAVALAPRNRSYPNTLGLALYRAGRFSEGRDVLQASLASGPWDMSCVDLFILAMCHKQLGEAAEARAAFLRAVAWRDQPGDRFATTKDEIAEFEAEARWLLGPDR